MERPCPIPGCKAQTKPGHLMCKPHWFSVPQPLRAAVNRTWANFRKDPKAYSSARQAAIDSIVEKSTAQAQKELF